MNPVHCSTSGEQVGDVDLRRESIKLDAQPDRGWGLVERFRRRQLEAIVDEPDTVARRLRPEAW